MFHQISQILLSNSRSPNLLLVSLNIPPDARNNRLMIHRESIVIQDLLFLCSDRTLSSFPHRVPPDTYLPLWTLIPVNDSRVCSFLFNIPRHVFINYPRTRLTTLGLPKVLDLLVRSISSSILPLAVSHTTLGTRGYSLFA
jgi:hypothetical protein